MKVNDSCRVRKVPGDSKGNPQPQWLNTDPRVKPVLWSPTRITMEGLDPHKNSRVVRRRRREPTGVVVDLR